MGLRVDGEVGKTQLGKPKTPETQLGEGLCGPAVTSAGRMRNGGPGLLEQGTCGNHSRIVVRNSTILRPLNRTRDGGGRRDREGEGGDGG